MSRAGAVPRVVLRVRSTVLPDSDGRGLAALVVRRVLSRPSVAELTFHEPSPRIAALALGDALSIEIAGEEQPLFSGEITALFHDHAPSGAHDLRVRAYDRLHRLKKRHTAKVWPSLDAETLARQLVEGLGISVSSSVSTPVRRIVVQHRQSDWALLVDVVERAGAHLVLEGSELRLITLGGVGAPIPLAVGAELLEVSVEQNTDRAYQRIVVAAWEPFTSSDLRAEASAPRSGRTAGATASPTEVGGTGDHLVLGAVLGSLDEAEALARAERDRADAGEVVLTGTAIGDVELAPGRKIAVAGLAPALSGQYVLTEVSHRIDATVGFITELSTRPPEPQARSRAASVTKGTVTHVDDPQALGRVRALLPAYDRVETDWMPVVSVGAAPGKGLVMTPDVGDDVMVLLADSDPGQGFVLGGLFGEIPLAEPGVVEQRIRRASWITADGHKVVLDDDARTMRLEDPKGSYVELAPDKVTVHAETRLVIEAPGQPIEIIGQDIDFKRG